MPYGVLLLQVGQNFTDTHTNIHTQQPMPHGVLLFKVGQNCTDTHIHTHARTHTAANAARCAPS